MSYTNGKWKEVRGLSVYSEDHSMKICDIRGWGHLTGKGIGALGLSDDEAIDIQKANARLIAAAPELLDALQLLLNAYGEAHALYDLGDCEGSIRARKAIAKATGEKE